MWIVVNIGCIKCGVSSDIVGVFSDKDYATEVALRCDREYGWREGGQNHFEVFSMPEPNVINREYIRNDPDPIPGAR